MLSSNPYAFIRGWAGLSYSLVKSLRNFRLPEPAFETISGGEDLFAYIDRAEMDALSNPIQFFEGRNHWGAPALGHIRKRGKPIGWAGRSIACGNLRIPCLQPETDFLNWETVLKEFRPRRIVDCGTAYGGSSVLFLELSRKLGLDPTILTIDIDGTMFERYGEFHARFGTADRVKRLVASSISREAIQAVCEFIGNDGPVLFHLDDCHAGDHVLAELEAYKAFLRGPDDVIIVGDTWDHGLMGARDQAGGSPYSAVTRFLNRNPGVRLDYGLHRKLAMPCNFIEGVLRKRPGA